jgi:roadblock/LC7 domain-containing protein
MEGPAVTKFDELIARPGVLMAGRFGPDGRIAEHKSKGLYLENPVSTAMGECFCTALTTTFKAMAYAVDSVTRNDFNPTGWLPMRSWIYSGGDYVIAVAGDEFLIAERARIGSLDELNSLLGFEQA